MDFTEVALVLDALDAAGVPRWVAGGWGVAALAGRQTREHRDLDLLVEASSLSACLAVLTDLGYARETDWLPARVEYGAPGRGWVDVHPVVFDTEGNGRQAGLAGTHFDYPAECFVVGSVHGRSVACLSVDRQLEAHVGYDPRPQDLLDIATLQGL